MATKQKPGGKQMPQTKRVVSEIAPAVRVMLSEGTLIAAPVDRREDADDGDTIRVGDFELEGFFEGHDQLYLVE